MTDLKDTLAALSEAVKKTKDKYFGDYEMSVGDHMAISTLVDAAQAILSGQLIPKPNVERVAQVMYEADDPWHTVWPWPNLSQNSAGADKYREIATVIVAAMKGEGKGDEERT